MTLGLRLRESRLHLNLTQAEVAGQLFVSPQTISRWELDQSVPGISYILEISSLYNVSLDYLLKGDEKVKKSYQKKEYWMKFAAVGMVIVYSLIFAFFISQSINAHSRTLRLDQIQGVTVPEKLDAYSELSVKYEKCRVVGFDSQFEEGKLYITVMYEPIAFFNKSDEMSMRVKDLADLNQAKLEEVHEIYLVETKNKKYDGRAKLKNQPVKQKVLTVKE